MLTTRCDGRRAVAKFCKSGVWDKLPKGSTVIGIAHIVCEAGSMKRYGVRPSLCSSVFFMHGLLEVCCCEPGGQEISIDCYYYYYFLLLLYMNIIMGRCRTTVAGPPYNVKKHSINSIVFSS